MVWKLSTSEKKSCVQIEYWTKDGFTAQREIGWRWCWASYDNEPDLSNYNPDKDQIELYSLGDVCDMEQSDGCWEEWTWPKELDEDEIERLEDIFNEEYEEGLENEGWELDDTEYWVTGKLNLTKED